MTNLELSKSNPHCQKMEELIELAKAIVHVSVNPAMDRDDWEPYHGIPSTPSLS